MTVQRYGVSGYSCGMRANVDGDYVMHYDYAALERERDELREELNQLSPYAELLNQRCIDDTAALGAAEKERDELRIDIATISGAQERQFRECEELREKLEDAQALASQINTDWIPANKALAARAKAAEKRCAELEGKLTGAVRWLEQNQPDVFRRGIWDAALARENTQPAGESK